MKVSKKKENWIDYSEKLKVSYIPRILYVLATRPKQAIKKSIYMAKEKIAFDRLNQTAAKDALSIITEENDKLNSRTGQYDDIWKLYAACKKDKPQVIWEFGPGWTTIGLAVGLLENGGDGVIYTMEPDYEWYKWYERVFKKLDENIQSRIKLIHSPTEIVDEYDERSVRHTVLPEKMPNLVHIDGCSNEEGLDIACDLADVQNSLPENCRIILDGRVNNLRFLERHIKRPYSQEKKPFSNSLAQPVIKIGGNV